jgi:hypothetical protein
MQIEDAWRSTEVILWNGYDAYRWVEYAKTPAGFYTKTFDLKNLWYCFRQRQCFNNFKYVAPGGPS